MKLTFWGVWNSIPEPISNSEFRYKVTKILKKAVKEKIIKENQIEDFINPPLLIDQGLQVRTLLALKSEDQCEVMLAREELTL